MVGLGKLKPQSRFPNQQARDVFEFKSDQLGASAHAFRIALCLLDYDRVERAEDELQHRMMCMVSGIALKDPRIPNSLMPLPLDNQRDIDIAALHYVSLKTGDGRHIGKLPPGGLRGDAFWQKIVSGKHFDRYRKRSLNQLLKALRAQNDDYRV